MSGSGVRIINNSAGSHDDAGRAILESLMGQAIISEPDGVKSGEANHHRDEVYYQENAG